MWIYRSFTVICYNSFANGVSACHSLTAGESPWHSTDTLSAGPHSLTINPSTDPAQGLQIPFVVGENY